MKKIIIPIVLSSMLLIVLIYQNQKKYIIQDDMMLALTLDGNHITAFPERGAYNIEIDCGDTAKGKWLPKEWKLVVEDIVAKAECNINFSSNPTTLINIVETHATKNSDRYDYRGKQPDNWIWFNDEKWRIIGSIPTILSDGTETNLVKIIRSESIGGLPFDSVGLSGIWGNNSLFALLNEKYYGKVDATGQDACTSNNDAFCLCNYENIGISNESTDYYGSMIKDVYWNVGIADLDKSINEIYRLERKSHSSVIGKIGLMSASDYGYATSGINYSIILANNADYELNNWLFKYSFEWTLTPTSDSDVMRYDSTSSLSSFPIYYTYQIRPAVYLDSAVYVISGDGSENNPYQIGMQN